MTGVRYSSLNSLPQPNLEAQVTVDVAAPRVPMSVATRLAVFDANNLPPPNWDAIRATLEACSRSVAQPAARSIIGMYPDQRPEVKELLAQKFRDEGTPEADIEATVAMSLPPDLSLAPFYASGLQDSVQFDTRLGEVLPPRALDMAGYEVQFSHNVTTSQALSWNITVLHNSHPLLQSQYYIEASPYGKNWERQWQYVGAQSSALRYVLSNGRVLGCMTCPALGGPDIASTRLWATWETSPEDDGANGPNEPEEDF